MRRGLVVFVLVLSGCDPLASSDYVGEPMFTMSATLVTATKQTPEAGGIALAWQDPGGAGGPGVATTVVPVKTRLDGVTISVPLPPPLAARFAFDDSDVELAEAFVLLVDDSVGDRPVPHGISRDRVLVFATGDVRAGTKAADYLGGPMTAGYHLRKLGHGTLGPAQQLMIDRCVAAGSTIAACAARRDYQLEAADDTGPVRIVVTP